MEFVKISPESKDFLAERLQHELTDLQRQLEFDILMMANYGVELQEKLDRKSKLQEALEELLSERAQDCCKK